MVLIFYPAYAYVFEQPIRMLAEDHSAKNKFPLLTSHNHSCLH